MCNKKNRCWWLCERTNYEFHRQCDKVTQIRNVQRMGLSEMWYAGMPAFKKLNLEIWRFPARHRATPSHHPFLDRIFPNKNQPAILGFPMTQDTPRVDQPTKMAMAILLQHAPPMAGFLLENHNISESELWGFFKKLAQKDWCRNPEKKKCNHSLRQCWRTQVGGAEKSCSLTRMWPKNLLELRKEPLKKKSQKYNSFPNEIPHCAGFPMSQNSSTQQITTAVWDAPNAVAPFFPLWHLHRWKLQSQLLETFCQLKLFWVKSTFLNGPKITEHPENKRFRTHLPWRFMERCQTMPSQHESTGIHHSLWWKTEVSNEQN